MDQKKDKILLEDVNQYFNKRDLFDSPASIELKSGTVTMLYGRSGTGKSALFDMMSYLIPPRDGKVFWEGEEISSLKHANKMRSKYIGMIFSNFSFISLLSIKENIMLAASLSGKEDLEQKLDLICDGILKFDDDDSNLDLRNLISKNNVKNLSNGQKEIIAIASALLMDAKYLFVDEMLRSFPVETRKKIWRRLLKHFQERGTGLFYISHWEGAKDIMEEMGMEYHYYRIKDNQLHKEG
jgi:ABC-type lipoprotein export system ATPase subunit